MKAIDLFCGCGGMSRGVQDAGYQIVYSIDFNKKAVETYRKNFGHAVECADITKVDAQKVKDTLGTQVDVIFGGPPCQGFSMAGKRDSKDPRNALFKEFVRFVDVFKPRVFVMENVPGILTMKTTANELVIDIITGEFEKIGYKIAYKKLYAPDYGVPQKRRRVFIIGIPVENQSTITFPSTTHARDSVTMQDVLMEQSVIPEKYFHSQKMIDGFNNRLKRNKERGVGFGPQFVKINSPCSTLSARYYKDGSEAIVAYDETTWRMLTERECARVQTFPDDFEFEGSARDVYTQIGNAVPCRLAEVLARHIKETLLCIS